MLEILRTLKRVVSKYQSSTEILPLKKKKNLLSQVLAATAFCLGHRYLPVGEEVNKVETTSNISIVFYLDWLGLELLFSGTTGKKEPLRFYIFMSLFRRPLNQ